MKTNTFIKNSKFKSEIIKVQFQSDIKKVNLAARFILSRMMENYSYLYKTKQAVSKKLEELYGASFYVQNSNAGKLNILTFSISYPSSKYSSKNIANDAENFLLQQINKQDLTEENFLIEKQNAINSVITMQEDKMYVALNDAKNAYFTDSIIAQNETGTLNELKKVKFEDVVLEYKKLIKNQFQVIKVGNSETKIKNQDFKFQNYAYSQKQISFKQKTLKLDVEQTKIIEIFTIGKPIKKDYFKLMALNDLLGGQTSSLLFSIVREKLGLAYEITSFFDFMTGTFYVAAGIEKKNINIFHKTLLEIINQIKSGDIDDELLFEIKQNIINTLMRRQDQINNVANRSLISKTFDIDLSYENSLKKVEKINIKEIIAVAKKITPQFKMVLKK